MSFQLPVYHAPDFSHLTGAPDARFAPAPKDGVAPVGFHSTSMYPEYFKIGGKWTLAPESRMDCSVVLRSDGTLDVVENRRLRAGDRVVIGRTERGEDGIYLHVSGFEPEKAASGDQFAFRQGRSRPTPATTTVSSSCCATSVSTGTFSGSWARPLPSTKAPAPPCRS